MRRILAALGAIMLAGQAHAAVVMRDFEVTASGFGNFFGMPAPFQSVVIRFGVTYDDATNGFLGAPNYFTAITEEGINSGPFSATPAIGYFQPNAFSTHPRLLVGGALNGTNVMLPGTDDFSFSFDPTATGPTRVMMGFSSANNGGYIATNAMARAVMTSSVPESATWALMLMGFGTVGYMMRRRRAGLVVTTRA